MKTTIENSSTNEIFNNRRVPRYAKLAKEFREQIASGILQPGDRLPSFAELRSQFGVTPTTIDRVFSILEQEALIVREQGRGTFVANVLQTKGHTIGFLGGFQTGFQLHAYWSEVLSGMQEVSAPAGFNLGMMDGNNSHLRWQGVAGVLVAHMEATLLKESLDSLPDGMPCVAMMAPWPHLASVAADDGAGIRLSIMHLMGLGHRRIAYLSSGEGPTNEIRRFYFKSTLSSAAIKVSDAWLRLFEHKHRAMETAHEAMRAWLDSDWEEHNFTAILAQNDEAALGIIAALQEVGKRVPEDVSVVGFDAIKITDYTMPQLTTVAVPLRAIGARATQLLLKQIESGRSEVETIILPVSLHVGDSTSMALGH